VLVDPESIKIQLSHQCGSTNVKAVRRTLMKLTPGVNFTSMFTHSFYMHRYPKCKKM
jgi:hypothetical protein